MQSSLAGHSPRLQLAEQLHQGHALHAVRPSTARATHCVPALQLSDVGLADCLYLTPRGRNVLNAERMEEWTTELMDAWMHGCMNEWMNAWMNEWITEQMNEQMDGWVDGWDGWMDEWMDVGSSRLTATIGLLRMFLARVA